MKGHIRRRGRDSWAVVVDEGRDETGRRRQRWHTVRGTKKDAERELVHILNSLHTGMYVEPTSITVAEYLNRWLAEGAKSTVSGKTFERYTEIVNSNLAPALGEHRLATLQPLHIQTFYSAMLATGRRDGRGGLSPQTVLHIHRVLHRALQQAVRWQLLVRNPAGAVQPPRAPRNKVQVINTTETATLLRRAEGTTLHIPILLAVSTGMRRGEIAALAWTEVDLGSQPATVRVVRSLEQTKGDLRFKVPKTATGARTLPLPSFAATALCRHKSHQAAERLRLGGAYDDQRLVCARPDGTLWPPGAITSAFLDLIRRAGLSPVSFHGLRHSHATQLLVEGVNPKVVSERLGHTSVKTTLDLYAHVTPGLQEDAAARLDRSFRAALKRVANGSANERSDT